jgi:hypothetical protein
MSDEELAPRAYTEFVRGTTTAVCWVEAPRSWQEDWHKMVGIVRRLLLPPGTIPVDRERVDTVVAEMRAHLGNPYLIDEETLLYVRARQLERWIAALQPGDAAAVGEGKRSG